MTLSTLSIFSKICLILQTDFCLIVTLLLFPQSSGMQHPSRTCQRSVLSRQPLALRPSSWITPSPIFFSSVRLARGLMTCHLSLQSADCEALLSPQHCWGGGRLRRGRRAGERAFPSLLLAPKPSLTPSPASWRMLQGGAAPSSEGLWLGRGDAARWQSALVPRRTGGSGPAAPACCLITPAEAFPALPGRAGQCDHASGFLARTALPLAQRQRSPSPPENSAPFKKSHQKPARPAARTALSPARDGWPTGAAAGAAEQRIWGKSTAPTAEFSWEFWLQGSRPEERKQLLIEARSHKTATLLASQGKECSHLLSVCLGKKKNLCRTSPVFSTESQLQCSPASSLIQQMGLFLINLFLS